MAKFNTRIDFSLAILEASLNEFNLHMERKGPFKYELYYVYSTEFYGTSSFTSKFFVTDEIKKIFDFCGTKGLYENITTIQEDIFLDILLYYHKYANSNLIDIKLYKKIKEKFYDSQELKSLFYKLMKKKKKEKDKVNIGKYLWTKYETMYIKSIDNFFDTSIEKNLNKSIKSVIDSKFNKDIVYNVLSKKLGKSNISSETTKKFMEDFKDSLYPYTDVNEYLLCTPKKLIEEDLTYFSNHDSIT